MSEACLSASDAVHPAASKFITVIRLKGGEPFPPDIPGETERGRLQTSSQDAAQRRLHLQ